MATVPPVSIVDVKDEEAQHSIKSLIGLISGPVLGVLLWFAPLALDPKAKHALAIVVFMIVYWIFEPIDHGLTALAGCYLFWALKIVKFEVAFAGFTDNTPWFLFGAMLMGVAAAQSGLAKRIGLIVMGFIGTSYAKLLLSVIVLVLILNFLVPSGMAQVAIIAPMIIGVVGAFGVEKGSNIGRGLFIILTYTCGLFNKMILAGGASILTRGMVEKLTGKPILWSQYFIAYLPATLITVFACWLVTLWLYPPEKKELPGGRKYLRDSLAALGPWTAAEKKTLAWLLLAICLWSTDFLHGISPAVIAMGIGLVVALPKVGVLTTKDIRSTNFLLIIFLGGALSMGEVLIQTKALDTLTNAMMAWMEPLLGGSFKSSSVLYWTAFAYHFVLASELSMLSTSLPVIIRFAQSHGYNPVAFAMLWNFASGGKLFVYQSSVMILGYAYGYFDGKDMLKVGLALTIVEGLILMFLVPIYWPMIGMQWNGG
ncbi:MAG TPA: SLC13 family permease [Bryobacteraceae bacterium]|nr:SLC13 family permease [Bryobacteraceae bacterium]